MAQRRNLRASDADRELVAERLREATGEGRLGAEELEHRLGTALSARTYGELDSVLADLPGQRVARPRARAGAHRALATATAHPLLVIASLPFLLAAVAIVAAVVTGLAAIWLVWVALMWLAFGRGHPGRPVCAARHPRRGFGPPRQSAGTSRYWA